MTPVSINGRWQLLLPEHRAERQQWPWWEATRLAHMHHLLGDGGHVVYDIGAEEGDFPALWASWGNDVVLFEPNARVWSNVRTIFEANDLPAPLACFEGFAASESSESVRCNGWPESSHGPLIGDHGFCNLAERDDIQRITIDDMAGLTRAPSAITIDVEGAELHVLTGAESVLRRHRPLVWVSVHPAFMQDMYGVSADQLGAYMRSVDYELTPLCTDHEVHQFWSPVEFALGPQ